MHSQVRVPLVHVEAQPTYAVAVPETLVVTLPAAVLMTGSEVVAAPSALVRASPGAPALDVRYGSGALDDACTEAQVRTGSAATIVLTLTDDEWVDDDDDGSDWSDTDDAERQGGEIEGPSTHGVRHKTEGVTQKVIPVPQINEHIFKSFQMDTVDNFVRFF